MNTPTIDKAAQMAQIASEINLLTQSPLYAYRVENKYKPVIGEGNLDALSLLIGEAPGEQEAKQGRPFVGAAGRVLNDLLQGSGIAREDLYITSVIKDRPPKNRSPLVKEIKLYAPYLARQIAIIQPQIIGVMGRFALDFIVQELQIPGVGLKISEVRGKPIQAKASYGNVTVLPLYHPAVVLYRPEEMENLRNDFLVLGALVKEKQKKS